MIRLILILFTLSLTAEAVKYKTITDAESEGIDSKWYLKGALNQGLIKYKIRDFDKLKSIVLIPPSTILKIYSDSLTAEQLDDINVYEELEDFHFILEYYKNKINPEKEIKKSNPPSGRVSRLQGLIGYFALDGIELSCSNSYLKKCIDHYHRKYFVSFLESSRLSFGEIALFDGSKVKTSDLMQKISAQAFLDKSDMKKVSDNAKRVIGDNDLIYRLKLLGKYYYLKKNPKLSLDQNILGLGIKCDSSNLALYSDFTISYQFSNAKFNIQEKKLIENALLKRTKELEKQFGPREVNEKVILPSVILPPRK